MEQKGPSLLRHCRRPPRRTRALPQWTSRRCRPAKPTTLSSQQQPQPLPLLPPTTTPPLPPQCRPCLASQPSHASAYGATRQTPSSASATAPAAPQCCSWGPHVTAFSLVYPSTTWTASAAAEWHKFCFSTVSTRPLSATCACCPAAAASSRAPSTDASSATCRTAPEKAAAATTTPKMQLLEATTAAAAVLTVQRP